MVKFRDWEDHLRSKIHDYIEDNRGFILNSQLCSRVYEYLRVLNGYNSFKGNDLEEVTGIQRVIDVVFAFDEEFSWRKVNQFEYRIEAKSIDLKQTSVNWLHRYLKSNGETSMGPLGSNYYEFMHQYCSRIRLENTLQFNSLFDFIKQFPNIFDWKQSGSNVSISLPKPYILITSDREAMEIKEEILSHTKYFIDCEWDREERICLMQILPYGSTKPYIFDLFNMNNRFRTYMKYYILNQIFESKKTKIFHDHKNDMRVIQNKFGFDVDGSTIYDTQMKFTKNKIGLNDALTAMGINDQKSPLNVDYRRYPNFWRQRPLTEEMLTYAAKDVTLLKKLYDALELYIKKKREEEEEKKKIEEEKRRRLRPTILFYSQDNTKFVGQIWTLLLSTLKQKSNLIVFEDPNLGIRYISSPSPPPIVLISDESIVEPQNQRFLSKLVEYTKQGGKVLFCGTFSTNVKFDELTNLWRNVWGLEWRCCAYTKENLQLNRQIQGINTDKLNKSYYTKSVFLKNVDRRHAVYQPMDGTAEYPSVFAPYQKGYLGFIGDVNGESEPTNLILSICNIN